MKRLAFKFIELLPFLKKEGAGGWLFQNTLDHPQPPPSLGVGFFTIFILAFFAAGCAHDLTAPLASVPVTSVAEYFWSAGTSETLDAGNTATDKITTRDSNGMLLAKDSNPNGALRTTLVCRVSADSVFAEGFKVGSLFDLDKGPGFVDVTSSGSYHPGGVLLLLANPVIDSSW